MNKQIILLLAIFVFSACSALPFSVPTSDAPATETRIAGIIYATQTANAPTPDPRVTATKIAADIFATLTASAPTPTPTPTPAQVSNISCSFLLPSELPNFASDHTLIYSNVQEWEQDTAPWSPPTKPWADWLKETDVKSICYDSFQGTNVYDANGHLLPEFDGKPVPAVGTFQITFGTPEDAHTVFEKMDWGMQPVVLTAMGDESKAFVMHDRWERISYGIIFRKRNTLVFVGLSGPIASTPSSEIVRIAKVMETKIQ